MSSTIVVPKNSPPPLAPYSPGVVANGVLYVSGMLAMNTAGESVGVGDIRAQTRHVLESIRAVVDAAGGSMSDITYSMIFLKDLADYQAMNEIYVEYFQAAPPARYCIKADLVRPEFLVEIGAIAHLRQSGTSSPSEVTR